MHSLFRRRILKWWQKEFWSRKSSSAELKGMQAVVACTRKVGSCCAFFTGIDSHSMCLSRQKSVSTSCNCPWPLLKAQYIFYNSHFFAVIKDYRFEIALFCLFPAFVNFLVSINKLDENLPAEEIGAMQQNTIQVLLSLSLIFYVQSKRFFFLNVFRYLMRPLQSRLAE